jgi:uncharacterized protein
VIILNGWELLVADALPVEILAMGSLVLLLLASCVVWCLYFAGRFRNLASEEPTPSEKPALSFPALALVIFLVGSSLFAKFSPGAPAAKAIQVEDLQARCFEGVIFWGLLLGSLLIVPQISLKDYGFRFRSVPRQLAVGGLAFLASLLPVYLLLRATTPLRSEETLHPLLKLLQSDPGPKTIFWIGLSVSIMAPFLEEMIYRVILQTSLRRWLPVWAAIVLTALIFCIVHGWPDMIPLLPLALVLGWVYHHHQSYLAVVAAHALFNSWMLAWALLIPSAG